MICVMGSLLAMRNVSIYTIAELLGHSSIKMSMRYAHLSQGHKHDAVSLLNGICSDAQKKIIVGNWRAPTGGFVTVQGELNKS